ncbi:MAG TPA: sugar nucleotide-binding protein, partial [Burkholderiaceae bacterium]|nr:sugar nucleotide-binding protein [Burkholderiaceae bacterium]
MRILLLGKNGQVGWELQRALAPLAQLVALDFASPGPLRADFTRPEARELILGTALQIL